MIAERGRKRVLAVIYAADIKAFRLQAGHIYICQGIVVFDEKDAFGMFARLCNRWLLV